MQFCDWQTNQHVEIGRYKKEMNAAAVGCNPTATKETNCVESGHTYSAAAGERNGPEGQLRSIYALPIASGRYGDVKGTGCGVCV